MKRAIALLISLPALGTPLEHDGLGASGAGGPGGLVMPPRWVHGAPGEPALQVHEAGPGTWILRESKRANFEAPFLYLLAGRDRALLLDTGARPAEGVGLPLRETVDRALEAWELGKGLGRLPLVVAHTHGHGDHTFGDAQLRDRPDTVVIDAKPEAVAAFFGLGRWPEGEAAFDLGGRVLTVMPLPGHESAHIAIHDALTGALFTGDSLYPGLLTIRDWPAYRASVARLAAFAASRRVSQVLGAHIEMTRTPGVLYPLETPFQPEEHALPLTPAHLVELDRACRTLGDFRHEDVHDAFILSRVLPPSTDRPSTHGMLVAGEETVYLSHLPMLHSPHDYQLIFSARLPETDRAAYAADRRASDERVYTLAPAERWVLPQKVQPGASFAADLYRGHFERGGTAIRKGIAVVVERIVHFRRFEAGRKPSPSSWIAFGQGRERFLAHRIEGAPDLDQVVEVTGSFAEGRTLELPVGGALADGQKVGDVSVRRVLYTERDDLKE